MSANETYYEILGVEQDVDISVIKKAYRKLILKYHPDRNQDNRELAEEMTKKINEAYEVLSNEEKRREYDEKLADDSDGDMEYIINSQIIRFNDDMKIFAGIYKKYKLIASLASCGFKSMYDKFGGLDGFHESGLEAGFRLILQVVDKAVEECIELGLYNVNRDTFINFDKHDGSIFKKWLEAYAVIDEQWLNIEAETRSEEERRELRKQSRSRMVGMGYGLTNSVIASAEAGAYNMASGAVHSIFNSIGNAFTRMNARHKKEAIYDNIETYLFLQDTLKSAMFNVSLVLAFDILKLKPFERNLNAADAMIDNLMHNRIPQSQIRNVLIQILQINPWEYDVYEIARRYFTGDDLKSLNRMADKFGIDAIHNMDAMQYFQLAKIESENKNYARAKVLYDRAVDMGYIPAILELAHCYFDGQNGITQDREKALQYFKEAAAKGSCEAKYYLAIYNYNGKYKSMTSADIFKMFNECLEGDLDKDKALVAKYCLGMMYYEGEGTPKDGGKAFAIFQEGAQSRDLSFFGRLGDCYYYGVGTNVNYKKAVECYQKAVAGVDFCKGNLGICYYNGTGVAQNYNRAFKLLNEADESAETDLYLGKCYFFGRGTEQDLDEAQACLDSADAEDMLDEEGSYCFAMCLYDDKKYDRAKELFESLNNKDEIVKTRLGDIYYRNKNYRKALEYLLEPAKAGNPIAQYTFYKCYFDSTGIKKTAQSTRGALNFLKAAGQNGYPEACRELSDIYLEGKYGINKNAGKAIEFLTASYKNGDRLAAYKLGLIYFYGQDGVNIDYNKAFAYLSNARDVEYPQKYYILAKCYEEGKGTERDLDYAFVNYSLASKSINKALIDVGRCYQYGLGTDVDYRMAISCYEDAAQAGLQEASERLAAMQGDKSVQKQIRKEERHEANERRKESVKSGFETGCGCLIWIVIIFFVLKWLFD